MPRYLCLSLDSIIENTAPSELEITVVDSLSDKSETIREIGHNYVDLGLIKRFVSCNTNCKGYGLKWAYQNFPTEADFFIFTDLDLILTDPLWLDKLKDKMTRYSLSAASLSLENYVPPNGGHKDDSESFGFWLMGVKKSFYEGYAIPNNTATQDCHILTLARTYGGAEKYDTRLYHLSWDLWKDNIDYFNDKARGIDWLTYSKDSQYNVYEAE